MSITYGNMTLGRHHTRYYVEAVWPNTSSFTSSLKLKWGRYQSSAFNDRNTPNKKYDGFGGCKGTFDLHHPDVANVPERIRENHGGFNIDYPVFSCPRAALAYAERLQDFGELASKYDNMDHIKDWRERHSQTIKTRVVEEQFAIMSRVVEDSQ